MYCWQLPLRARRSSRQHIAVYLKIGEMEQSHLEMFLAEPKPWLRLSRQHLCCHKEKYIKERNMTTCKYVGTARTNGKPIPSLITEDKICQQAIRTSQSAKRYEPLYPSTEDFSFWTKILRIFFFQKEKIGILYKSTYLFSYKMMYSFSFCFASFNLYLTTDLVKPYFSIKYMIVIFFSPR